MHRFAAYSAERRFGSSQRLTPARVKQAVAIFACPLILGGVLLSQRAAHEHEVAGLRQTLQTQRLQIADQQNALGAASAEIGRLQDAVTEQQQTIGALQQQAPQQHMSSTDDFTTYLEAIIDDGIHTFGRDLVCSLLKAIWNALVPESWQIN